MITIRYADLPEGLHALAQAQGRRTVIYLRPALTAEQRRLSLRRARHTARMGYGPRLSATGVALAVARDVAAGTLANVGAAVRRHPVGSLLLSVAFAALMVCYALFVTVSVRLILDPAETPAATRGPLASAHSAPPAAAPRRASAPASGVRAPGRPDHADPAGRAAPGGGSGQAAASAGPVPSPGPSPAVTPSPSPSPSLCLTVGPVGVCL